MVNYKNPLQILWKGKANIYEYQDVMDKESKQTTQKEILILEDEPCFLSHESQQATDIKSGAAVVSQSIKIFIRPDITIKPGSLIEVTQNNRTEKYSSSGKPAVYTNHQEIILELHDRMA